MKRLSKLLATLLITALAVPAFAHGGFGHGGHGGYGGYGGYGPYGGFRGNYEYRHGWSGNNWVGPVIGATIVGGAIYAASRPAYVVQQQPIVMAPPPQGAYYCSAYQQFYPNVPTCPVPWQIVPYR